MKTMIKTLWEDPAAARKFWVALVGALVLLAAQGAIPEPYAGWITIAGPFIVSGAVYAVPNRLPGGQKKG